MKREYNIDSFIDIPYLHFGDNEYVDLEFIPTHMPLFEIDADVKAPKSIDTFHILFGVGENWLKEAAILWVRQYYNYITELYIGSTVKTITHNKLSRQEYTYDGTIFSNGISSMTMPNKTISPGVTLTLGLVHYNIDGGYIEPHITNMDIYKANFPEQHLELYPKHNIVTGEDGLLDINTNKFYPKQTV